MTTLAARFETTLKRLLDVNPHIQVRQVSRQAAVFRAAPLRAELLAAPISSGLFLMSP